MGWRVIRASGYTQQSLNLQKRLADITYRQEIREDVIGILTKFEDKIQKDLSKASITEVRNGQSFDMEQVIGDEGRFKVTAKITIAVSASHKLIVMQEIEGELELKPTSQSELF